MTLEKLSPATKESSTEGQLCTRSTRMQAEMINIAAQKLTPDQQARLREIASELEATGVKTNKKLFETFKLAVKEREIQEGVLVVPKKKPEG